MPRSQISRSSQRFRLRAPVRQLFASTTWHGSAAHLQRTVDCSICSLPTATAIAQGMGEALEVSIRTGHREYREQDGACPVVQHRAVIKHSTWPRELHVLTKTASQTCFEGGFLSSCDTFSQHWNTENVLEEFSLRNRKASPLNYRLFIVPKSDWIIPYSSRLRIQGFNPGVWNWLV